MIRAGAKPSSATRASARSPSPYRPRWNAARRLRRLRFLRTARALAGGRSGVYREGCVRSIIGPADSHLVSQNGESDLGHVGRSTSTWNGGSMSRRRGSVPPNMLCPAAVTMAERRLCSSRTTMNMAPGPQSSVQKWSIRLIASRNVAVYRLLGLWLSTPAIFLVPT